MTTMAHLDAQVAAIVQAVEQAGLARADDVLRRVGPRVQDGEAADPAERGLR